jgi:hypothetical protein
MNDALLHQLTNPPDPGWPIPEWADSKKGRQLLIVGSGRCVWDDLAQIGASAKSFEVMAINDMIMHLPLAIDHASSTDSVWLPKWVAARRPHYRSQYDFNQQILLHSNKRDPHIDAAWPLSGNGTSGLFSTLVGCAMGYDEIILCGIPMDGTDHYFDPPEKYVLQYDTHQYAGQERYWKRANAAYFDGKVKSMSGNTKEWLS